VRVTDGWTFALNYGYLDASFDKYLDNSFAPGRPAIDTADNRLPGYAPENTFGANLDGRLLETQYGNLRLIVDYTCCSRTSPPGRARSTCRCWSRT